MSVRDLAPTTTTAPELTMEPAGQLPTHGLGIEHDPAYLDGMDTTGYAPQVKEYLSSIQPAPEATQKYTGTTEERLQTLRESVSDPRENDPFAVLQAAILKLRHNDVGDKAEQYKSAMSAAAAHLQTLPENIRANYYKGWRDTINAEYEAGLRRVAARQNTAGAIPSALTPKLSSELVEATIVDAQTEVPEKVSRVSRFARRLRDIKSGIAAKVNGFLSAPEAALVQVGTVDMRPETAQQFIGDWQKLGAAAMAIGNIEPPTYQASDLSRQAHAPYPWENGARYHS